PPASTSWRTSVSRPLPTSYTSSHAGLAACPGPLARVTDSPVPDRIVPAPSFPMASNSSFDISTGADLQEVDNAVNQALKEIAQRYDFKGTHCTIDFDRAKAEIRLAADDEFRMDALVDVLHSRMIKRGVPV